MDLNAIRCFIAVAEHKNFTLAARQLGLPKSFVSRKVQELEDELKTTLLRRGTRVTTLTERAIDYYQSCKMAIEELQRAEQRLLRDQNGQIKVRIGSTTAGGMFLLRNAVECDFSQRELFVIDYVLSDGLLDLSDTRLDFSIRMMSVGDDRLVAKNLGPIHIVLVEGAPQNSRDPSKKKRNKLALFRDARINVEVAIKTSGMDLSRYSPADVVSSNDLVMIRELILRDGYLGFLPFFMVQDQLAEKNMHIVMGSQSFVIGSAYMVYSKDFYLPDPVRSLMAHVEAHVKNQLVMI